MAYAKTHLNSIIFAGFLFAFSLAQAANPNELGLVIISDPHVDISLKQSTSINPAKGVSQELDKNSYETLIAKVGAYMDSHSEQFQAAILLGDLSAHNAFRKKLTTADMSLVLEKYYEKLSPNPLFYVFGNNDSPLRDYGAFRNGDKSAYNLFASINGGSNGFLSTGNKCSVNEPPCINQENTDKGYYSASLGDHLKLLSLNSVLFVSRPGFSPSREGDKEELTWLYNEIKASRARHENIILAMHVPPQQWENAYLTSLKNILKAYPEVVVGMLAAHTHFDELHAFKITNSGQSFVIPIIYSAGLGTDHSNAASFKTLAVNRKDNTSPWFLKDYVSFNFLGKTAYNSTLNQYYSFVQAFCPNHSNYGVAQCLQTHIQGNKFDANTSRLLGQHYTAGNPNNRQTSNPTYKWLVAF
ncbi:metallophosphoesterase [Legionella sp. km772]|uniref:metallophosphoesterase n=1 Tax=Legionella sp. km772 TaxID=2498111 RepID=UPI000F8C680F|nr:metallophosphoesterase [Legionella sp. km772]RUR11670.1 hypothetical protein ELY15_06825 [Legionella sp. km772]